MEKKRASMKIPNNINSNKLRLIKKNELKMLKDKPIKNFKQTKSNTPKYYKNKNFKIIQNNQSPPKSNKNQSHNKLLNVRRKISSVNNSINNPIGNNNTYNLQFYIQNNNSQTSYRDNINNSMGNEYIKNIVSNNYKNINSINNSTNNSSNKGVDNYINVEPVKLELKTDNQDIAQNINNNNNNLKILIDIMNSDKYNNSENSINTNENENKICNENFINKINSRRIYNKTKDKLVKYSNTEISKNSKIINNLQSPKNGSNEIKIDNMKSIKVSTIKDLFNKFNNNKYDKLPIKNIEKKQSNNNILFIDSNIDYEQNAFTSNPLKRYSSANQKSLSQQNNLKNSQENYKKIVYNIKNNIKKNITDGNYTLKKKIKSELDQFKKNKELSQQLEAATKELDKMQNIHNKYLSSIHENIEMQKKYNFLIRRNDNISQEIDDLYKKIEEKENI
jgi:hypothetical protein